MTVKKHYTIPFFIPHKGCPHQCVFCDQNRITGASAVRPEDVDGRVVQYLSTMPEKDADVEVGFFGGTFTSLPPELQMGFLDPVQKHIEAGRVSGIRLSTRPDAVSADVLSLLKERNVNCIELGVQSMSDDVLRASRRGHTARDVENASRMINAEGFILGHQMILGLPSSAKEDEYFTARRARELGARQVRIYPMLVMEGTELADLWRAGRYMPLSEEEALERSARLIIFFGAAGIKVIRCGLHPSEGILSGADLLAGPFHPAFRQKAEGLIFALMLGHIGEDRGSDITSLAINPSDESAFFGFEKKNVPAIERIAVREKGYVKRDPAVPRGCIGISSRDGETLLDRKKLTEALDPMLA